MKTNIIDYNNKIIVTLTDKRLLYLNRGDFIDLNNKSYSIQYKKLFVDIDELEIRVDDGIRRM